MQSEEMRKIFEEEYAKVGWGASMASMKPELAAGRRILAHQQEVTASLLDAAKFAFAAMNSDEGRRRAGDVLVAAIAKATT